jgi:hypothetical protein
MPRPHPPEFRRRAVELARKRAVPRTRRSPGAAIGVLTALRIVPTSARAVIPLGSMVIIRISLLGLIGSGAVPTEFRSCRRCRRIIPG